MKLIKIFLLSLTLMIISTVKTSPLNLFKVVLGTAVTIGSAASFVFYLEQAIVAVIYFPHSLNRTSTFLVGSRLIIDALAVIAGVTLVVSGAVSEYEKRKNAKTNSQEETTAAN